MANYEHVLGEVLNSSGRTIYDPQITVTYYKADNSIAGTQWSFTDASMIQSGERAPFDNLDQPAPGWTCYTVAVTGYDTSTYTTFSHSFQFSGQNQWNDGFDQFYAGQINNTSGVSLNFAKVILTGYNANGAVIIADYVYPNRSNSLAPGASVAYELMEPLDRASQVTRTAFFAEGQQ